MLQGGPLSSQQLITDQERLQAILKKRIALMDDELEGVNGTEKVTCEKIDGAEKGGTDIGEKKKDDESGKVKFIRKRDRKKEDKEDVLKSVGKKVTGTVKLSFADDEEY